MKTRLILTILSVFVLFCDDSALAAPEVIGARVTDVTPVSFSVVWMTDMIGASPEIEVAVDSAMSGLINDSIEFIPMAGVSPAVADSARAKGIMKVVAVGLEQGRSYYVRAVTRNPQNESDAAYSDVLEVTTAAKVVPYTYTGAVVQGFSNDLKMFPVHIRPSESGDNPGRGDLIILEADGASYPVTAFAGEGVTGPKGLIDLNNMFGTDGLNMDLAGGERLTLRVYEGDLFYTLTHFRKVKADSGLVYVVEPEKGFFADIDIDGKVDDTDFEYFREQYKTVPEDDNYNPDYNFVADGEEKVDVREFSKFALEYGRMDVE